MKRFMSGIIVMVFGALVALMTACSSSTTGEAATSDGVAQATLMTQSNKLDGYETGEYRDPGFVWVDCKSGQTALPIMGSPEIFDGVSTYPGATRNVEGNELYLHFADEVPEIVALGSENSVIVFKLDASDAHDYVVDLSFTGDYDDYSIYAENDLVTTCK